MKKEVLPFERTGLWTTGHSTAFRHATHYLEEYRGHLTELLAEESRIAKANDGEELVAEVVSYQTTDLRDHCLRSASAATLFASMAFEAFLNTYGVRRLRSDYYKRFVERMGISEKVAYLLSVCCSYIPETDDEVIVRSRRLFDARNGLAHIKSKEIDLDNMDAYVTSHPSTYKVERHFEDLHFCIDLFCSLDSDLRKEFEFRSQA